MLQVRDLAERHITFVIRSGNSHFWFDNWLGSGSLSSRLGSVSDHRVSDFFISGGWNSRLLSVWVLVDIVAEITRFALPRIEEDDKDAMGVVPPYSAENLLLHASTIAKLTAIGLYGVLYVGASVRGHMSSWWFSSCKNAFIQFAHRIIPSLICWNIWKARNKARFDDKVHSPTAICGFILDDIRHLFNLKFLGYSWAFPSWPAFYASLVSLRKPDLFRLVKWVRPIPGHLKLNTDGCSRGNLGRAGRGGVLRNSEGRLLFAFSTFLGHCTSIQAEVKALLFGVNLCISCGYVRVQLEVDSLVLVQVLQRATRYPWSIDTEIRSLLQLSSHFVSISHCFRESNKVADGLSNIGCEEGCTRTYHQFSELPTQSRGAFRLDRIGLPSLRKC
ncbi:uncharacterized protein [Coffea arabica]|uniref:RNase H type-1 domain-containing protein n=1 Tax=Coffea arabica TaxID=13443 RepID=A0ABM4WN20_COFAR